MTTHEAPPNVAQIVEALRSFLYEEVAPKLDDYTRFQCRVAVNLLGILGRELSSRGAIAESQRARMADILDDQEAELDTLNESLAALLRSGEVSLDDERIARHVRLTQAELLSISNPKWLGARTPDRDRQP